MKKGIAVFIFCLVSFGTFADTKNTGISQHPEITENDVVPDMAANINRQKALLCDDIMEKSNSLTCKRLVDNMVTMAYSQGEASMGCRLKANDPEFEKVPKMGEFCDNAHNLIRNLSSND